jgi:hypothetical protein
MVHFGTTDVERHSERKLLALRKPRPDNSVFVSTARLVAFYFYGVTKVAMLSMTAGTLQRVRRTMQHLKAYSKRQQAFDILHVDQKTIIQKPILAMCGSGGEGGVCMAPLENVIAMRNAASEYAPRQ